MFQSYFKDKEHSSVSTFLQMKCNSLLWIAHLFLFCCLSHTEHQACNSVCIYTDVRSLRSYFVLLQFFLDLSMQFNLKKYIHMSTSNYRFKRYLLISVFFFSFQFHFYLIQFDSQQQCWNSGYTKQRLLASCCVVDFGEFMVPI